MPALSRVLSDDSSHLFFRGMRKPAGGGPPTAERCVVVEKLEAGILAAMIAEVETEVGRARASAASDRVEAMLRL